MTLQAPDAGETFHVRIYKKLTSNPALIWSNIYEVRTPGGAPFASLQSAAGTLVEFERQIHLPDVQFDRVVISTWVPDGTPYDPTSFYTEPLIATGIAGSSGQALSLNHVLFVRRQTLFGQNGKLYYRRCVGEGDMEGPSGTPALVPLSTANANVEAAVADVDMQELIVGGGDFELAMIATGQPVRRVIDLVVGGLRIVQFNNRYFDVP